MGLRRDNDEGIKPAPFSMDPDYSQGLRGKAASRNADEMESQVSKPAKGHRANGSANEAPSGGKGEGGSGPQESGFRFDGGDDSATASGGLKGTKPGEKGGAKKSGPGGPMAFSMDADDDDDAADGTHGKPSTKPSNASTGRPKGRAFRFDDGDDAVTGSGGTQGKPGEKGAKKPGPAGPMAFSMDADDDDEVADDTRGKPSTKPSTASTGRSKGGAFPMEAGNDAVTASGVPKGNKAWRKRRNEEASASRTNGIQHGCR